MALTNYSDLTAAIASWTARSDYTAANYSDFTTLFESWANRKLQVSNMETSAALTTVSGVVALPSDYVEWRSVTWNGSTVSELEYLHPSALRAFYPTNPSGNPRYFTIYGSTLDARPYDDSQTISLDYWQKIPTLVTGSTNWLMTNWPDIYLCGVLTEAYLFNKDPDTAGVWKQRRDALGEEINMNDRGTHGPAAIRTLGPTP